MRIQFYKFATLIFINLFLINFVTAQKKTLDTPSKFKDPKEESNLALSNDDATVAEPWAVFSDKSGNVSYTQPNGGTVKKNLGFLDLFYVVGVSGEWINIYKGDISDDGSLKTNAQDYGWIKSENLLLWKKCLKKNEISRKAMLLNTFEGLKAKEIVKGQGGIVKFYKDPALTVLTDKETNLFEIYFIYKQTATSYLLGKDERVYSLESPQSSIYGWVSKSKVTPWDHRVALIPNTKEYAIADRKSKNIKARIFDDQASAGKSKENKPVNDENIIWDNDEYKTSYPGSYMRFPVISNQKEIELQKSVLKMVSMGQITSQRNKNKSISSLKNAEMSQSYNKDRAKKRKINVVFVIDGTNSMGEYFRPVSEAVSSSMKELDDSKNDFRFGAVVYRDAAEGARKTEICKPTSNISEVTGFLNRVQAKENGLDKDAREAVYFGLWTAMRGLGLNKEETNLIVLIGDAGNHTRNDDTFIVKEDLINAMSEKRCHFLAFQVNNKDKEGSSDPNAYASFVAQTKEIALGIQEDLYAKLINIAQKTANKIEQPVLMNEGRKYIVKNNATFAQSVFVLPDNKFAPADLKKEIKDAVLESDKFTEYMLKKSNEVVSNGQSMKQVIEETKKDLFSKQGEATSKYVSSYAPALLLQIADMEGMTDEKIDILCDERYQLSSTGYANVLAKDLTYPLFEPVLFMTSQDLSTMITVMTSLVDASKNDERRKKLKDTWVELLKKHMGNVNTSEFENLTMEQINLKIFGLPYTSEMLKGLKLKDIEDKSIIDDVKLGKWIDMVSKKIKNLSKKQNISDDDSSFLTNDQRYFWIEQNLLP